MTWRQFLAAFVLTPLMMAGSPTFLLAAEMQTETARATAAPASSTPALPAAPLVRGRDLPPEAVIGSTPERRAAWESLTPAERQDAVQRFREYVAPALENELAQRAQCSASAAPREVPRLAGPRRAAAVPATPAAGTLAFAATPADGTRTPALAPLPDAVTGVDLDGDTLDDGFEAQLADYFTPSYHVSAGEAAGTGFARFGDYVPQTVIQNLPPVPPASHYRVKPLGVSYVNGAPYRFVQVDYLTLWNRDDGLAIGGFCATSLTVLFGLIGLGTSLVLDGAAAHPLDNERSAALVAAPLASADNAAAYSSYDYYLAAHEGTFLDHSIYLAPPQPMPAGNHLLLGLSRAKHATYQFNPDYYPLMPSWVISTTYGTISSLYFAGWIDYYSYLLYLYMADTLFYSCIVEHFTEQGGAYASPRINVGEPNQPINASGFIRDTQLYQKLTTPLWVIY